MRKIFIVAIIVMLLLASGCGGAKESPQSVSDDSEKAQQAPAVKGETYETERFSLTVPEGWSVMDVDGGVQLYKMSGEVFEMN